MRTHRFDPLSFIFGATFVGVGLLALTEAVALTVADVRWIGPGLLVILGIALVLTAAVGSRDSDRADAAPVGDSPATEAAVNGTESAGQDAGPSTDPSGRSGGEDAAGT